MIAQFAVTFSCEVLVGGYKVDALRKIIFTKAKANNIS